MKTVRIRFTTDTQLTIDARIDLSSDRGHEPLTLTVAVSVCGDPVCCLDEDLEHLRPIYRATASTLVAAARALDDARELFNHGESGMEDGIREALWEIVRNTVAGLLMDLGDTDGIRLKGRQLLGCIVTDIISVQETDHDNAIDTGALVAWERGELDDDQTARLFQRLIDTGTIGHLQGCYQREAMRLVAHGTCRGR
jgi:hypothetical protein